MPEFKIEKSALLMMDLQVSIVERYANDPALLTNAGQALAAARKAGMRVIYVVVNFRPGYPEVSPNNKGFNSIKQSGMFISDTVHPAVAPLADEVVITKHRVSAFAGTDMDMILRANGIDTLVLAGIATSGVILSTLRHAADADYGITVLRDCCGDLDPLVHECLINKVFPRQARVIQADEFVAALQA